MTTISARVVEDGISVYGCRLTTFLLRYPRWIHAEGRTHRLLRIGEELELPTPSVMDAPELSRNASSSRAIPVERLIKDVMDDPAIPMYWGANQRGMQAGAECNEMVASWTREEAWLYARDRAVEMAKAFSEAGYHKQIVNRLLEPFSHINVVVTATEWSNFFALRIHEDAEPHVCLLATKMKESLGASVPTLLAIGEWHLPFIRPEERKAPLHYQISASVARCARTSYLTHEGRDPIFADDLVLADRLLASVPLHASPAEHQATPDEELGPLRMWKSPHLHGNFVGFIQYRKTLEGECQ